MKKKNSLVRRLMVSLNAIDNTYIFDMARNAGNESEMWLMYALDDGEPHSQKSLCRQWGFSKTTLNSTVKRLESQGILIQQPISGKRREKHILLTAAGKEYAKNILDPVYEAESDAISETLKKYPDQNFIEVFEFFGKCLKKTMSGLPKRAKLGENPK